MVLHYHVWLWELFFSRAVKRDNTTNDNQTIYEWMYLLIESFETPRVYNKQARALTKWILWLPKTHLFTPHHVSIVGRCKFVAFNNVYNYILQRCCQFTTTSINFIFWFPIFFYILSSFMIETTRLNFYQISVPCLWYVSSNCDPIILLTLFIIIL